MTQTQNGLTAGNSQPVKKTYKQDRHFTVNQLRNAQFHHHAGATLAPSARNTKDVAVATFAEKKVFSRPEFMGLGLGVVEPQGHQHGYIHVSTPSPIRLSRKQANGCKSHVGAFQMAHAKPTTTPTSGNTTHDHHQAALVLRATTHLSEALYQLRNNTGTTPTRKAMGLAYAAGRALSQVVGGAV